MDAQSAKYSQVECRLFFKEEENGHLTNRFRQSQNEAQEWKKSYEEEHLRNEQNVGKFGMYDEQISSLKEKMDDVGGQCLIIIPAEAGQMECCIAVTILHVDSGSDARVLQQACNGSNFSFPLLIHQGGATAVVRQGGVRPTVQQDI